MQREGMAWNADAGGALRQESGLATHAVLQICQSGTTVARMKTLTIKVPDAVFAEIAEAARARNVPKSEIVRERLSAQETRAKGAGRSLWSQMEDLVITSDSLPRDLSSNPAHLRRYGKNRADR
jgi:hypothetical protein